MRSGLPILAIANGVVFTDRACEVSFPSTMSHCTTESRIVDENAVSRARSIYTWRLGRIDVEI